MWNFRYDLNCIYENLWIYFTTTMNLQTNFSLQLNVAVVDVALEVVDELQNINFLKNIW